MRPPKRLPAREAPADRAGAERRAEARWPGVGTPAPPGASAAACLRVASFRGRWRRFGTPAPPSASAAACLTTARRAGRHRRTLPASSRSGVLTTSTLRGSLYLARRSRGECQQVGRVELLGIGLDDGVDDVAAVLVGESDHAHRTHRRVLLQRGLDLGRVDVGATGEDHVLHPVAEVEVAVLVEPTHVAERLPPAIERAGLGADVAVRRSVGRCCAATPHPARRAATGCRRGPRS